MKKTVFLATILAAALLTGCGKDKPLDSTSSTSTSSTSSTSSSTSSSSSSTSSSSTSSSTTSSELVPDWYPGSTSTSSTEPTPKPIQSSSTSTTPAPDPKPTPSSSSTFSSQLTPDIYADLWTPDAPGNKPGPYGGYYDAGGNLHCKKANMPKDDKGYPLISYYTETGAHSLTYEEMQKYMKETERIDQGGKADTSGMDWGSITKH